MAQPMPTTPSPTPMIVAMISFPCMWGIDLPSIRWNNVSWVRKEHTEPFILPEMSEVLAVQMPDRLEFRRRRQLR
jgi:hypothetical protein